MVAKVPLVAGKVVICWSPNKLLLVAGLICSTVPKLLHQDVRISSIFTEMDDVGRSAATR